MTTALDYINRAFRLANILGEGQVATGDQASDALDTFNDMLQAWNLSGLMLYATTNDQVTLIPNQSVYTIGTGGDFSVDRPVQINSMYQDYQGVSFPIYEVNQDEYNLLTLKTMTQPLVRFYLYVPTNPLGTLTFWPVPTAANNVYLSVDRVLANVASTGTTLNLPPGYARCIRANLAVEFCTEYGRPVPPQLMQMARESKADIQRANRTSTVAEFDPALIGAPGGLAGFLQGY